MPLDAETKKQALEAIQAQNRLIQATVVSACVANACAWIIGVQPGRGVISQLREALSGDDKPPTLVDCGQGQGMDPETFVSILKSAAAKREPLIFENVDKAAFPLQDAASVLSGFAAAGLRVAATVSAAGYSSWIDFGSARVALLADAPKPPELSSAVKERLRTFKAG